MFKKNLLLAVIVCNVVATVWAMDNAIELPATVKLPSAGKLREYLWKGGFGPFVNRTHIDIRLDNQELSLVNLSKIVDVFMYRYIQDLHEDARLQSQHVGVQVTIIEPLKKERVLRCILRDSPKVYKGLVACEEEAGFNYSHSKL